MAATDSKRINCVKVCFTDREYIDLNREAIKRDRKLPDLIYQIARQWAYGNRIPEPTGHEGLEEANDAQ